MFPNTTESGFMLLLYVLACAGRPLRPRFATEHLTQSSSTRPSRTLDTASFYPGLSSLVMRGLSLSAVLGSTQRRPKQYVFHGLSLHAPEDSGSSLRVIGQLPGLADLDRDIAHRRRPGRPDRCVSGRKGLHA